MRRVLRLPAYRRLLIAYTLNELALGVGTVALAILVYRKTGSAVGAASFFLAATFVPALIAPVLVSRFDRGSMRITLQLLYLLEGGAFGGLTVLVGSFQLAPVLALTLFDGVLALVARSLSRASTVAVLKPADLLREGNALTNAAFSVCYLIGPGAGGAVVVLGGTRAALLVNCGLFVAMAVSLATSSRLPRASTDRSGGRGRLRAAIRYARRRRSIRELLGFQTAIILFGTMPQVPIVVLASHTLHDGAGGYGAILSGWGGGAVLGSAIYARWREVSSRSLLGIGGAAIGLGIVGMGLGPTIATVLPAAAVGGIGNGIAIVASRTALQEHLDESWMARVTGLAEAIAQAVPGAGYLLGAGLTAAFAPRLALVVAGVGALAVAIVARVTIAPDEPQTIEMRALDPLGVAGGANQDVAGAVGSLVGVALAAMVSIRTIRSGARPGQ